VAGRERERNKLTENISQNINNGKKNKQAWRKNVSGKAGKVHEGDRNQGATVGGGA